MFCGDTFMMTSLEFQQDLYFGSTRLWGWTYGTHWIGNASATAMAPWII